LKPFFLFVMAVFAFVGLSNPAYAYIDPGSGSMILQVIALAFIAGWFAFRNFWRRIVSFFTGRSNDETNAKLSKETEKAS